MTEWQEFMQSLTAADKADLFDRTTRSDLLIALDDYFDLWQEAVQEGKDQVEFDWKNQRRGMI